MLLTHDTILEKLKRQVTPTIVISDFDGTLFSPDFRIVTAPFYNRQTAAYLQKKSIPVVIATGRSDWQQVDKQQLALAGLLSPDAVIAANGTIIYFHKGTNQYERDFAWETSMHYSKVTWANGNVTTWNKLDITREITTYLATKHISYKVASGNTFLIRIKVHNLSVSLLEGIRKEVQELFPKGIRFLITEKLLWKNTVDIFSGDLLITPKMGGKDMAVKYLLEKLGKEMQQSQEASGIVESPKSLVVSKKPTTYDQGPMTTILHAVIFGDASVDTDMLTLKSTQRYALSQFAINPTPILAKELRKAQKINPAVHILKGNGPKEILRVLQGELTEKRKALSFGVTARQEPSTPEVGEQTQSHLTSGVSPHFSPAQNNPTRQLLKKLEPLLNKIVDSRLSPNEVSFLGLTKLQESLEDLQTANASITKKFKGMYTYSFANLTDVLDGIRARQRKALTVNRQVENSKILPASRFPLPANDIPGHLVDGFCDRAKEFMQLYARARQRLAFSVNRQEDSHVIASDLSTKASAKVEARQSQPITHNPSLITFLAALSCALPSIAREQVEITGNVVPERDSQGGSMIDRTKKLFFSLFMDINGAHTTSLDIDQEIYSSNIATFKNRIHIFSSITKKTLRKSVGKFMTSIQYESFSDFQKTGLEKFLLYVDVLQQEDTIIKKYLSKNLPLLKEYEKASLKLARDYLELPIARLRKKWKIADYKLEIKKYI